MLNRFVAVNYNNLFWDKRHFYLESTVKSNTKQKWRDWNWEEMCVWNTGLCSGTVTWKSYILPLPRMKTALLCLSTSPLRTGKKKKTKQKKNDSTFSQMLLVISNPRFKRPNEVDEKKRALCILISFSRQTIQTFTSQSVYGVYETQKTSLPAL